MPTIVKVKPFGVFKLADSALAGIEANVDNATPPEESIKEQIKKVKKDEDAKFFGINPDTKEMFSFIPIIDDDKFFISTFPDPVQLYYSLAFSNYQFSIQTRKNIVLQKGDSDHFVSFVNSYLYNWHLQHKISTVVFLHSTVEAFLNYIMPDEFIYRQQAEGDKSKKYVKQTIEYNKEGTEKWIQFKEKLNEVFSQVTNINLRKDHQKIYDKLLKINELRNNLIHLRSSKSGNAHHFHDAFDKVINLELKTYVLAVKDFLNLVIPDFIEFETYEAKDNGIFFDFKNYAAFKLDITIFLQVLKVDAEIVTFRIPVSKDKEYQIMLNWIMQNLDVMAKEQIIYFPTVEKTKTNINIKVRKCQTLKEL